MRLAPALAGVPVRLLALAVRLSLAVPVRLLALAVRLSLAVAVALTCLAVRLLALAVRLDDVAAAAVVAGRALRPVSLRRCRGLVRIACRTGCPVRRLPCTVGTSRKGQHRNRSGHAAAH